MDEFQFDQSDFQLLNSDEDDTLTYIGRFDAAGSPIVTSRYLCHYASVAFQVLSLANLMQYCTEPGSLQEIVVDYTDDSVVGILPYLDEFIAYSKSESKRRHY